MGATAAWGPHSGGFNAKANHHELMVGQGGDICEPPHAQVRAGAGDVSLLLCTEENQSIERGVFAACWQWRAGAGDGIGGQGWRHTRENP